MLEPKTCKYVLTIESPSLCELINGPTDEYGIFTIKPRSNIQNEESKKSFKSKPEDKTEYHARTESTIIPIKQDNDVKKKLVEKIEL